MMNVQIVSATCRHCGAPLANGAGFCGQDCAAAFYRRVSGLPPPPRTDRDLALDVRSEAGGVCMLDMMVEGLQCSACVWLIEIILQRTEGVLAARVNFSTKRLHLEWRGGPERAGELVGLVERLGFRLTPFDPAKLGKSGDAEFRDLLRRMAVAGFAAANVMLLSVSVWAGHASGMGPATRDLLHWLSALIALPAIFYAGQPFFRSAWAALSHRRTNMDVPISIGVLMASAMSLSETLRHGPYAYFDSAVTLLFFLLIGRVLDRRARGRTREAATHLLSLGVAAATRLGPDGTSERIPVSALRLGDLVLVAAGERIGADGTVIDGVSDLDAGLLTGESQPAPIKPGDRVFAGQVNLSAPFSLRVEATGDATLLADIVRLMEAAEGGRARYRLLADRLTRLYAPVVHFAALATFLYWIGLGGAVWQVALLRAVSVLIITCPCALGLAIPAVQVAASGWLLRRGILLKSATALERLADIDSVVFDKTGTLTMGRPELRDAETIDRELLAIAAGMAQASRHPLSRALAASCPNVPPLAGVEEVPGRGLRAGAVRLGSRSWLEIPDDGTTDPELWLSVPGRRPQRFVFSEVLRPDAVPVVARLRKAGLAVALLSGDRCSAVRRIASLCAIEQWLSEADPAAKVRELSERKARGDHVLMVGDGLNDAPALAAADVSLSPASAADIAQNAADVVFQGNSLTPVCTLLSAARRSRAVVRENLAFAVLYNLAAVPLAIAGLVTPLLAAVLMSSSSLIVVLNALRLNLLPRREVP